MGDDAEAKQLFHRALQIAAERQVLEQSSLDILVGLATLQVRSENKERALELTTLITHHLAYRTETADRTKRLLDELQAELPPDVYTAAQERGRALDLDATVAELLAELGPQDD